MRGKRDWNTFLKKGIIIREPSWMVLKILIFEFEKYVRWIFAMDSQINVQLNWNRLKTIIGEKSLACGNLGSSQTNCSTNPCQLITKSLSSYRRNLWNFSSFHHKRNFVNSNVEGNIVFHLKRKFVNSNILRVISFFWALLMFTKIDIYADRDQTFPVWHKLIRLQKHTSWPEFFEFALLI